jgi:hypothetical protein
MTAAQKAALGNADYVKVDGTAQNVHVPFKGLVTVPNTKTKFNGWADEEKCFLLPLKELVKQFDIICVVLPINLIQQLLPFCEEKPLLVAVNKRVASGTNDKGETAYEFVFDEWVRYVRIDVITEPFTA